MNRRRVALVIIVIVAILVLAVAAIASLLLLGRSAQREAPAATMPSAVPEAPGEGRVKNVPVIVERNGVKRASCGGACAIEAQCGFRERDQCERASCDGDVRIANKSDFCFADAADCAAAAACPCEEACWKRGECAGDHASDKACTASCAKLVAHDPKAHYDENRCIIESKCDELATCANALP